MSFHQNALKSFPKIVAIGKNYIKHVKQMGGTEVPQQPVLFIKSWSSLVYNPKELRLDWSEQHRVDHQLELGVYLKKGGKNIKKEEAMGCVGGYFLGIDFSDRDLQNQCKSKGMPWEISKSQDNFCPISPLIEKQINPYDVELEFLVNGSTKQKESAGAMHFKVDQMICFISKYITLNEGDLILTGTPDGTSGVKPGDKCQAFGRVDGNVVAELQFDIVK